MNERETYYTQDQPNVIRTGARSFDEFFKANPHLNPIRHNTPQPQYPQTADRRPVSKASAPRPKAPETSSFLHRHRVQLSLAGAALLLVGGGFAWSQDAGGMQEMVFGNGNVTTTGGVSVVAPKLHSENTLGADYCEDPANAIMEVEVSGYEDIVPLLATTKNPNPEDAKPYMTKGEVPKAQVTSDGFGHINFRDFPIDIGACFSPVAGSNSNIIITQNGKNVVDTSKLDITFTGYDYKFGMNITPTTQTKSANQNPDPGNFVTVPYATLWLSDKTSDATYNKSVDAVQAAMSSPAQTQALINKVENDIRKELMSGAPIKLNAPAGTDGKFDDAITKALIKRFLGETGAASSASGAYVTQQNSPIDPTTKQSVINSLKEIDPNEPFHFTNVTITDGAMQKPKPPTIPTTTPTPTPTPSK